MTLSRKWIFALLLLSGCAAERKIRIGAEHNIEQRETKISISAEFTR